MVQDNTQAYVCPYMYPDRNPVSHGGIFLCDTEVTTLLTTD